MDQDIKKIKEIEIPVNQKFAFIDATKNWLSLTDWLREQENSEMLFLCLVYEVQGLCRPQFIDRIRTRYNKVKSLEDLKTLQEITGKVISVNYV